jgi:co-chaperonin GroES (HSP10)
MIEPEGVKILVLPDAIPEKTEGGIWRPDMARESEQHAVNQGTVVSIGPAAEVVFADGEKLQVNDRVIFAKYGGFAVKDGDIEYRVLNDEDVIARIHDAS